MLANTTLRSAASRAQAPVRSLPLRGAPARPAVRPQANLKDDFYEINQQLLALKAKLENGAPVQQQSAASTESVEVNSLGYACDENGCVLLNLSKPEVRDVDEDFTLEELLSGSSWSLGLVGDSDSQGYCAEIGSSGWSVSLTQTELKDFVTALRALRSAVRKMGEAQQQQQPQGGQDGIRVKRDTNTVKLEAVCLQDSHEDFSLKFMVGGLRVVKGSWSRETVAEVLAALDAAVPGFAVGGASGAPAAAAAAEPVAAAAKRS